MTEDKMPDCVQCIRYHAMSNKCDDFMFPFPDKLPKCIDGKEFKQSQPIRLYKVEVTNDKRHTKQGCNVR